MATISTMASSTPKRPSVERGLVEPDDRYRGVFDSATDGLLILDVDGVVLTTYGRSSGFCVDPIEKKPLHHFLPGSATFSFGTAGCNLACRFCQNWDITKSKEIDTLADDASPAAIAQTAHDLGCRSVAFTYNDPVIFDGIEFNPDLYWIDVMSEVAFLVMDLQDRQQPQLANRFLTTRSRLTVANCV